MVPGVDMDKDPKVTVTNDIDCYVFVEIAEANWPENNYITYAVANGWTELVEGSNIWWREVTKDAATKEFYVLSGGTDNHGQVVIDENINMTYMAGLNENNYPKLSFTPYVVQKEPFGSASEAWQTGLGKTAPTTNP